VIIQRLFSFVAQRTELEEKERKKLFKKAGHYVYTRIQCFQLQECFFF